MRLCKCGCGKIVKTKGREYSRGCRTRGKTYNEIFKGKHTNCGFRPGNLNAAKQTDIKEKIRKGVLASYTPELRAHRSLTGKQNIAKRGCFGKLKYTNSVGHKFRSRLEVSFSEMMIKHGIKYEYEYILPLIDGTTKVVDFKIGETLVEITGYAYKAWREDFDKKLIKMRDSCTNQIVLLTYPKTIDLLLLKCPQWDVTIGNILDEQHIIEKLAFCSAIHNINHIISTNLCI